MGEGDECANCGGVRGNVEGGDAATFGVDHIFVVGHADDLATRERGRHSVEVGRLGDSAGHDNNATNQTLPRQLNRPLADLYRSWGGLHDGQHHVDGAIRHAQQRADTCFEVGHHDRLTKVNGSEQLLGG